MFGPAMPASLAQAAVGWASRRSPSNSTETSRDTPGSCMVTPYNIEPISMVRRLCVMMMNCVCSPICANI